LAVRIRLSRVGATKRPSYRVVAIECRKPRDGRSLEILGYYDPLTDPATVKIEAERVRAWIGKGAQPSDTVVRLLRQVGLDAKGEATEEAAKPRPRPATRAASRAAAARPKAASRAAPKAAKAEEATAEAAAEPTAEPLANGERTAEQKTSEAEVPPTTEGEAAGDGSGEASA
jgi:small subunit ribosomal protein S16